jgi:hypothetical protein
VSSKDVRITVARRKEIDFERLAEALLDLVASLEPDERDRQAQEGEALERELDDDEPQLSEDGSAA